MMTISYRSCKISLNGGKNGLQHRIKLLKEACQRRRKDCPFTRAERLFEHFAAQVAHRNDLQLALKRGDKKRWRQLQPFCTTGDRLNSPARAGSHPDSGLQQQHRLTSKARGHIAGELSGIITMNRLLYHNIQCPFNRADILFCAKGLRLPENGVVVRRADTG